MKVWSTIWAFSRKLFISQVLLALVKSGDSTTSCGSTRGNLSLTFCCLFPTAIMFSSFAFSVLLRIFVSSIRRSSICCIVIPLVISHLLSRFQFLTFLSPALPSSESCPEDIYSSFSTLLRALTFASWILSSAMNAASMRVRCRRKNLIRSS